MNGPAVHSRLRRRWRCWRGWLDWLLGWARRSAAGPRSDLPAASQVAGRRQPPRRSACRQRATGSRRPHRRQAAGKPAGKSAGQSDGKPDDAKAAAAKEEAASSRPPGSEIQRQMRSKTVDRRRVAGVRRLQGYPLVEAAKLAMRPASTTSREQVRAAAYETLLKFSTNEEICSYFLDQLLPPGPARRPDRKIGADAGGAVGFARARSRSGHARAARFGPRQKERASCWSPSWPISSAPATPRTAFRRWSN